MKKILFLGITHYDFQNFFPLHLEKKFLGLSREFKVYVLAKGLPFHKKIWDTEFYLLPQNVLFYAMAFLISFYLCFAKKIDVIISQSPLTEGFLGSILKKIFKKELIVEIHGDWIEGPFLSKKRRFEFLEKKLVPKIANFSLKTADKISGVADYLINRAKKIAPNKKYFLFHTFTDLDFFLEEKDLTRQNFIMFAGGLEKVKGVEFLIRAFSKISRSFPEFKLVILGEGSELENLQNLSSKLKLEDKVEFKGKLSLEQTKNIMKNCYCLVLPSLSEGLPRVLMEAMSLGKPVIASSVGGIPEIVREGENGFLFESSDSEKLAEKMKILLSDQEKAFKMGQKGKEFMESNFSNERYIKNYISIINE